MDKIVLFIFLISIKFSTAQSFQWVESIGDSDLIAINSITVDIDGNIITTGEFSGTLDFDPGPGTTLLTANNLNDVFVQKLDQDGNLLWAKSYGGNSYDIGKSIDVDVNGNIYVVGDFRNTVDFDPGAGVSELSATGVDDIFIQKLSPNGDFIWAKAFNGTEMAYVSDMKIDLSGFISITGGFRGTYDFDPGVGVSNHSSIGNSDIFIQKMDTDGNYIWSKTFGGAQNEKANTIDVDLDGSIYTSGYYESLVDFDPGAGVNQHTSNGSFDIYVQKLDANGNFVWVATYGGSGYDIGEEIAVDENNHVYLSGGFYETVDFDPGPGIVNATSNGTMDVFVQKLDENGSLLWINSFGGPAFDPVSSLVIDDDFNVYTMGMFRETTDFDPGPNVQNISSLGNADVFIQKLTSEGDFDWVESIGGVGVDSGSSIFVKDNAMYATGRFWSTVDFDFSNGVEELSPTGGNEDAFILKLLTCLPDSTIEVHNSCGSYTWIDDITYTSSNNTATYTFANTNGCDSVVTLDLTIDTVDASITQLDNTTLEAASMPSSYQWLDCNDSFSPISGENGQLFEAIENGSYAVQVTNNSCIDTSNCMVINSVGLNMFSEVSGIEIFPNPTTGKILVRVNNEQVETVILINSLGQHLKTINDVKEEIFLDLSSFSEGLYFLRLETDSGSAIKRIIKQ